MKSFSFKTKRNSPHSSGNWVIGRVILLTCITLVAVLVLRSVIAFALSGGTGFFFNVRNYFAHSGASLPTYIRDRSELQQIIDDLEEKLAGASGDSATIARLTAENDEFRALLSDTKDERILAGVIARPPLVPYDLLVIDRGSRQGILPGALVYHTENHAIGMVSRVFDTSSFVTLFSSAGSEMAVYLYGPNVYAYAYGEGGGVIRVSLPQGISVTVGDAVVLPSPHMGDLGIVERVVSEASQPEQSAYLTMPVPIQSIRSVVVNKESLDALVPSELETNVTLIRDRLRVEIPEALRFSTGTSTATMTPHTIPTSTP
jgi:cell shape-determining protein MreC